MQAIAFRMVGLLSRTMSGAQIQSSNSCLHFLRKRERESNKFCFHNSIQIVSVIFCTTYCHCVAVIYGWKNWKWMWTKSHKNENNRWRCGEQMYACGMYGGIVWTYACHILAHEIIVIRFHLRKYALWMCSTRGFRIRAIVFFLLR